LGMANVHVFAGVSPCSSILEVVDRRIELNQAITSGPSGVDFICGASGVSRLADLDHRVLDDLGRMLIQTAANYEVLVIDTGAGIGQATMHLLGLAHEIVVVSTPNLAATLDAYGMIKCIHERNLPAQLHLLVNLAENAPAAEPVFTRVAGCARQFLQRSVHRLGIVLHDSSIERANQSRVPLILHDPGHPGAMQLSRMAAQLLSGVEPVKSSSAA